MGAEQSRTPDATHRTTVSDSHTTTVSDSHTLTVSDSSTPTVSDLGERELITRLTAMADGAVLRDPTAGPRVTVGPGDDAAVLELGGPLVVSTDSLVQDRHFRLAWSTPAQIGARAVIQSAADIAAMGARCTGLVVSIACPPSTPADVVLGIGRGCNDAASSFDARVVGGDLVAADEIVVTVTALGATRDLRPVPIGGARPGDIVAISGPLGSSAAGLALLAAGRTEPSELIDAHRVPVVDLDQGVVAAAAGARAMTDVSDGLADELETMATAAHVVVDIDTSALPGHPALAAAAADLGVDVLGWQVGGGEDHQLLATFAGDPPAGWSVIGTVAPEDGGPRVRFDGAPSAIRGWQSF